MTDARYAAVLLDAYGTLVELDDPFERLRRSLARHIGVDIGTADAERAFRAEMAFYSEQCQRAADAESLATLKADCAGVILSELGIDADDDAAARMLADAVAFRAFPDAGQLLAGLEQAGVQAAVVSNWDCWASLRRMRFTSATGTAPTPSAQEPQASTCASSIAPGRPAAGIPSVP